MKHDLARKRSNAFVLKEIKSLSEKVDSKKGPKNSKLHKSKLQRDLNAAAFSVYDKAFEIRTLKNKLAQIEEKNSQLQNNLSQTIYDKKKNLKNPFE